MIFRETGNLTRPLFLALTVAVLLVLGFGFHSPTAQATLPGENGRLLVSVQKGPVSAPNSPVFPSSLYRLGLDGLGWEFPLSSVTDFDPALSPDGSRLAFVRNPPERVFLGKIGALGQVRQMA
ncbi:MAG: hypothetical protein QG596_1235 [Actinomycetota bacterium]|nr:hypothetical protein [Actinomycetota bacterium]